RTVFWGLAAVTSLAVCGFWAFHTDTVPGPEPLPDGKIIFDHGPIADAALILANDFTGKINDTNSLLELRDAVQARSHALEGLEEQLAIQLRSPNPQSSAITRQHYNINISKLLMYQGRFEDAAEAIKKSLSTGDSASLTVSVRANLTAGLGICSLRRGEIENCIKCVGPSSCIFPISREAIHAFPTGSREAIEYFTESLKLNPNDLRVRWLLNLAYMTLGEYPEKVPRNFLIPLDTFESTVDVGHFQNVAPLIGLTSRGTNQAGGSVFDDFTGDGLPDLFTTSLGSRTAPKKRASQNRSTR
ncbi:MAG: PpiC-type peptidyl-prolyl cis-trans isomerase, partial [Planctomycetota bacterium]